MGLCAYNKKILYQTNKTYTDQDDFSSLKAPAEGKNIILIQNNMQMQQNELIIIYLSLTDHIHTTSK